MLVVSLVTLGSPEQLTGGYLYHRRMAEAAPAHDARVEFVSFPQRPFPLAALWAPRAAAACRAADVVVVDSIAAAFLAAWPSPGPPLVGMLHQPPGGIDHGSVRAKAQAVLDRAVYRRCRLLLVASQALVDQLVTKTPVDVVAPGRDVAPPGAPPAGDLRRGRRAAVLTVGNWVERKGVVDLLDAFGRLPETVATLHLVGDDRPEPAYAARVRARLAQPDLRGRVVVHGPVAREQVASLYAGADLFALASYREPYGTVLGEAMAAGLPVVGWRAGNLPHLADHGVEGLVLPPGDVAALSCALERLATDEEARRRMGRAAEHRARLFPTWAQSAERFFGALRRVAEGAAR